MAETDTLVIGGGGSGLGLNSPWKKPVEKPAESPVMGEVTWPSLLDVHRAKTIDVPIADPQVLQISSGNNKKSNGGGGRNSSHKNGQPRYHRGGSKRNHQNNVPPFPVPLVPHVYPPVVPAFRPIPVHGYGYPPIPTPVSGADNHTGKSGSQTPVKGFGHQLHAMDASHCIHPPGRGDQAIYAPKYSLRKTNAAEGGGPTGHMHRWWQHPWPFGPKGGIMVQQNMAPRAYMRPAFIGPAPFGAGPPFPGPGHMHYRPIPPPGFIRAPFPPWFPPRLVNPFATGLPPETFALRESIVKQIEYYFSDENLLTDHYLISQMDDQGWVPISVIADFKRVKRMCMDIRFILDVLQSSRTVEVQGNKVRKRDQASNYAVVSPSKDKMVNSPAIDVKNNLASVGRTDSTTRGNTESLSQNDSKVDASSDNELFSLLQDLNIDPSDSAVAAEEIVALQTGYKPSDIENLPANDSDSKAEGTEVLSCSAA